MAYLQQRDLLLNGASSTLERVTRHADTRDAAIAYWRDLAASGDAVAPQEHLHNEPSALDENFAFIATCNLGERPLDDADIERILRIAARTWLRTLDHRPQTAHTSRPSRACRRSPPLTTWGIEAISTRVCLSSSCALESRSATRNPRRAGPNRGRELAYIFPARGRSWQNSGLPKTQPRMPTVKRQGGSVPEPLLRSS